MTREQLTDKKEDFEIAQTIVENIIEGEKIERFKFTAKEKQTLDFVYDLLTAHIKELEHF